MCKAMNLDGLTRRGLGLGVALAMVWAGAAFASVEEGAQPRKWPANPAKHQVSIRRQAGNDLEKKLIAAAEAAYPPKADVVAAGKLDPATPGEKLWSHRDIVGVKVPYAITGEAIAYYTRFVEESQKKSFTRYAEPSSRFTYEASVAPQENFQLDGKTVPRVFVVKMKISFDESFVASGTEGVQFNKEREVTLDPEGKVLQIKGDGDPEVPVVAI